MKYASLFGRTSTFCARLLCIGLVAASALIACGDDDEPSAAGNDAAGMGGGNAGTGADEGTSIDVDIGEFFVTPSEETAPEGTITSHVNTEGPDDIHELVVLKTDIEPDMLPLNADGDADEEADGVEAVGEVEDIEAGDSADLELELEAAKYVLICNIAQVEPDGTIEHHYEEGMYAAFTVE